MTFFSVHLQQYIPGSPKAKLALSLSRMGFSRPLAHSRFEVEMRLTGSAALVSLLAWVHPASCICVLLVMLAASMGNWDSELPVRWGRRRWQAP